MKDQAAIIGGGVTGKATAKALGIERIFDKLAERSNITASEAASLKYLFICVPTPTNSNGCDISNVEKTIKRFGNKHLYILRSTVIPGTADTLMKKYDCIIISNPEFLTEATAHKDAVSPDIIVLGSRENKILKDIRNNFYQKEKFTNSEIIETDNKTAEMIKYAINNFYAVKVIFANYLYQICNNEGIDYNTIKKSMYKRKWIGKNHLTVPHRNQFGVRGKCLPKDLIAFARFSKNSFYNDMIRHMEEINSWKP
jgi:UDPglucose 6-dehydrogenase